MGTLASDKSFAIPMQLRLSGSALKVIAVLAMLADHYALFMLSPSSTLYAVMRCFGRISFPIFALLLAEGFGYSRNRLRYLFTMLVFAIIAEVPWQMLPATISAHNVMFTLSMGIVAMGLFEYMWDHKYLSSAGIVVIASLNEYLGCDYGWQGVIIITLFYMLRVTTIMPEMTVRGIDFHRHNLLQIIFVFLFILYQGVVGAILSACVIFLYDGTRGFIKNRSHKYLFYIIYPLQFWIFVVLLHTILRLFFENLLTAPRSQVFNPLKI